MPAEVAFSLSASGENCYSAPDAPTPGQIGINRVKCRSIENLFLGILGHQILVTIRMRLTLSGPAIFIGVNVSRFIGTRTRVLLVYVIRVTPIKELYHKKN